MKIIPLISCFLCLGLASSFGQLRKGVVHLKTGEFKEGHLKIDDLEVKFWKNLDNPPQLYDENTLDGFTVFNYDLPVDYFYFPIVNRNETVLAKEVVYGNVCYYSVDKISYVGDSKFRKKKKDDDLRKKTKLYLRRVFEDSLTLVGTRGDFIFSRGFQKRGMPFFEDCSLLVDKLKNRDFTNNSIAEAVEYYNSYCE